MRTEPINILRHPILQEATNVCHAIEECGASEKLTQAVIKASKLVNSIDDLLNELDTKGGRLEPDVIVKTAEEKIRNAIKEVNDTGYFVLCAIINGKGEHNLEEIDYKTISLVDKKRAQPFSE